MFGNIKNFPFFDMRKLESNLSHRYVHNFVTVWLCNLLAL